MANSATYSPSSVRVSVALDVPSALRKGRASPKTPPWPAHKRARKRARSRTHVQAHPQPHTRSRTPAAAQSNPTQTHTQAQATRTHMDAHTLRAARVGCRTKRASLMPSDHVNSPKH
eukprot:2679359-Pleurochrysis_carterae.AAC.1